MAVVSKGLGLLFAGLVLSSCAGGGMSVTAMSQGLGAGWSVATAAWSDADTAAPPLDPRYRYLRVQRLGPSGQPAAYFALGFEDQVRGERRETWYSALRETLQIERGRVVFSDKLHHNIQHWRQSEYLPDWPAPTQVSRYRNREDVPGLAFGAIVPRLVEAVPESVVPTAVRAAWVGDRPSGGWRWYADRVETEDVAGAQAWRTIWLATDLQGRWRYSHQCFTPTYCLSLQPQQPS